MRLGNLQKLIVVGIAISLLSGFGLGDLTKKIKPNTAKCEGKSNSKKCKKREKMKAIGKVVIIGVAAKLIHDMAVSFKSTSTSSESKVINKYKKAFGKLPNDPVVTIYNSSLKPGEIVKVGKKVRVVSNLEVIRGIKSKDVVIQEKFSIYDNEDNTKVLKSITKPVNAKNKRSGAFKNEFKFTLPVGMPQGIYPIKSIVIVNNKEVKPAKNRMQLVLQVNSPDNYQIVALKN